MREVDGGRRQVVGEVEVDGTRPGVGKLFDSGATMSSKICQGARVGADRRSVCVN